MSKTYNELLEIAKQQVSYDESALKTQFTLLVRDAMHERGLNRSQLAEALGVTPANVTQILNANSNPTLSTMARIFKSLNKKLCLSAEDQWVYKGVENTDALVQDQRTFHSFVITPSDESCSPVVRMYSSDQFLNSGESIRPPCLWERVKQSDSWIPAVGPR